MKIDKQTVGVGSLVLVSSVVAASVMFLFTENMSALALTGWAIFFAVPQLALLPTYRQGSCRIFDRLTGQK